MKYRLTPGWYILVYHDVSWEESPFVRYIGGTCPPDVFRDHVETCATLGPLVSIQQGMDKLHRDDFSEPVFSFWFDDGLAGVRWNAAPILTERGLTAAVSVCSRFATRTEMFWRFKLSYLQSTEAGQHLQARLRKLGFSQSDLARHFTLDRFGDDVLSTIDRLYEEVANSFLREDAFRAFDTPQGLLELHRKGWIIANHSAAHYPIGEKHVTTDLLEQFFECEQFIKSLINEESDFWVFPFDRNIEWSAIDAIRQRVGKHVVLMRDKVNVPSGQEDSGLLYRIHAPANDRRQLTSALLAASRASAQTRTRSTR
jgi:Polysaccharide deacetylase